MTTAQAMTQQDNTTGSVMAWLKAKPTEELSLLLTYPWIRSLFSPEEIEEIYEDLYQREAEGFVEIGRD